MELALGLPVDRPVSRWDEMFIPMVIADEFAAMNLAKSNTGERLLAVDTMLFASTAATPAVTPTTIWYRHLLLGLLVTGFAWLSGKFMPPVWLAGLCHAWVLISASLGLVLAALWLFTDHEVASPNANLLLLNPLVILSLVPVFRRVGAVLLAGGVAVCFMLLLFQEHQYNLDVLALLTPINLAVAGYFMKNQNLMQS